MSIQSSIISLLGTAGLASKLSPSTETKLKIRNLEKQKASLVAAFETSKNEKYAEDINEINRQLFELDPSSERFKELPKPAESVKADPEELGKEIAEQEDFEQEVRDYADMYRTNSPAKQAQEEATRKADEAVQMEQERVHRSRMATLGINPDLPAPKYSVRERIK